MNIRVLASDKIMRIGEIDRTETIESEYEPMLSDDGLSLWLETKEYYPPKVFPDWDARGIEHRAQYWKREIDEGGLFLAVEEKGKITGFAILGPTRDGNCAEMVSLFVDKNYRSQGLGTALLAEVECIAKERGVTALTVQSNHTVRSVDFYRRMGYRIKCLIDNRVARFPESETGIILVKSLID